MSLISKKRERQKDTVLVPSSSIRHCQLINILERGSFVPYTTGTVVDILELEHYRISI